MAINIALDIGYGDVKCSVENKLFKFDSAVCYAKNAFTEVGSNNTYEFEGKKYLVGADAVSEAFTTRDYKFLEKYAPLLIYKAIELAGVSIDEEINLITGLSLIDWKNRKEQFANRISKFYINQKEININVTLVPQGTGIYNMYLAKYPEAKEQNILIDDIGYNTHDRLYYERGTPNPGESYATSTGFNKIATEIQTIISSEYGLDFPEQEIKRIIKDKKLRIGGQVKDLTQIINEETEKYFEFYMNEARSKKKALMMRADRIVIAGGTAYYLESQEFPENVTFLHGEQYEYLNVQGYSLEQNFVDKKSINNKGRKNV